MICCWGESFVFRGVYAPLRCLRPGIDAGNLDGGRGSVLSHRGDAAVGQYERRLRAAVEPGVNAGPKREDKARERAWGGGR